MQTIVLEKKNRVYLGDPNVATANYTVTASVFDESGDLVSDSGGSPLQNKAAAFDNTLKQWYVEFQPEAATKTGFLRILWTVLDQNNNAVTIDDSFEPQDVELISTSTPAAQDPQVVPVTYFIENYLALNSRMDSEYRNAIQAYLTSNKRDLARWLMAAQSDIERLLKSTCLFSRKDHIERDYFSQDFRSEFWVQQTNYKPIISVESYLLRYGNNPPVDISQNLAPSLKIEPKMGTIEFVPTAIQGNLFTALINSIAALGITIMQDGGYNRVPGLFIIDYTYGLDFPNLDNPKKESLRNAVARNCLIKNLPILDPIVRQMSVSKSVDGVSKSKSSGMQQLLKLLQEEEQEWGRQWRKEYASEIDIVVL